MTVNSCSFTVFLLLFIESVLNIQNEFQQTYSHQTCSYPYSCISTSECAERHATRGIDEVLFHCLGRQRVCCPPSSLTSTQSNVYSTTEAVQGCTQCSFEVNTPKGPKAPVASPSSQINPTESRKPGQSESRRPQIQPIEGRRPAQSQQPATTRPQQPATTRPQQPATTRPQQPATSRPQQPATTRPQQPATIRPQSSQFSMASLKSHRNFRLLPSESNCGVNNFANRITEGEEVSLGEYPWMVLTGLKDKYNNYRWNCGGTLINEWYVLTAAHCLTVDNRTVEYVRLGEHNLSNDTDCYMEVCLDPPEDIRISEIIPHEKWNTTTIKNDIALLRLSKNALTSGKSNIYPICLPFDPLKLNLTSSTKYEVAGWGKTDWNADEGSEVLRKASISGVSREECNICKDKKKQQYCPIVDTQLCIQGWKSVDVCKGDSGGPLMVTRLNIYQIGITSFKGSEYCGAENIPSIFTRVQSYLPWILDNIRE